MFSSVTEFNSLIGKATDRYRMNYKKLDFLRQMFFQKNSGSLDYERFTEYYKWIDTSVSFMVNQLFPISVRHSEGVMDVIDSHILERNKYQNKFPLLKIHSSTEASAKGVSELKYNWKRGHAPLTNSDDDNCLWQKEREVRTDIPERETIRSIIINDNNASSSVLAEADKTKYRSSLYSSRRLAKPYSMNSFTHKQIHGGINYPPNKDREFIHNAVHRHGPKTSVGIPKNVLIVGVGPGQGTNDQTVCNDVDDPNLLKKIHVKATVGRFAKDGIYPSASSDAESYVYRTDESRLPLNIISSSLSTGYNNKVSASFKGDAIFTNIHSDTTDFTNEVPMQGPFTEAWVGGHQSRHIDINKYDASLVDDFTGVAPKNSVDNQYTRPEAWRLLLGDKHSSDGAFGFAGFDYGGPYPDPTRKGATYYRGERAKRPLNLENIRTTTGSKKHGNFMENFELISAVGKQENNLYFRNNSDQANYLPASMISSSLQTATHVMGLHGQAPFVSGNIFGTHDNNRQPDTSELVITQGFYASASFQVTGATTGSVSSGSFDVFGRDWVNTSSNQDFVIARNDGATYRFAFGGADDPGDIAVVVGGSDLAFWANLHDAIESNAGYDVNLGPITEVTYSRGAIMNFKPAGGVADRNYMQGTFGGTYFDEAPFSISARVYISSSLSYPGYLYAESSSVGHGYKRTIHYEPSGKVLRYRAYHVSSSTNAYKEWNVTVSSSGVYDYTNQWMHLVVTHDVGTGASLGFGASDVKFYFNNTAMSLGTTTAGASSTAPGATWNATNRSFFLFNGRTYDENEWLGGLDEVALWRTVLNTNTVNELYNNGEYYPAIGAPDSIHAVSVSGSLIAWYRMGDTKSDTLTDGDTIPDQSSGSHNLTVNEFEAGAKDHFHYTDTTLVITKSKRVFNITSSTYGAIYNATMSTESPNNVQFLRGTHIDGATSVGAGIGDTYSILGTTFQLYTGASYTGSFNGVASTGSSNDQFWGYLSQSIKDNTVFDTITIADNTTHAVFSLTASSFGDLYNGISTEDGDSFSNLLGPSGGVAHDVRYANDIVIATPNDLLDNKKNRTIITSRFSSQGGPEVHTKGYLDVYSREYSVYNALPYRNLTVRSSGSGEAGTIRQDTLNSERIGLRTMLSRHSGKYGSDVGNVIRNDIYTNKASFHKIQRNRARKPTVTSTLLVPLFNEDHNNGFFQSPIPQSEFQYSWITASMGNNYAVGSGKQRIYGYAPRDGELSASYYGVAEAIVFPSASEIFGV